MTSATRVATATKMATATSSVIGVDVGASTISAGLVGRDGAVFATVQAPTSGRAATETIIALIGRALVMADERGLRVGGIGVGLPGLVDFEKGSMRSIPGTWVPELAEVPLAALIRDRSGHPVFVDNDVNALTLAEWMFGCGQGSSSLVTMAIGTGIGAGIVLDGALLRGSLNTAGEIGHLPVSLAGPVCACGAIGCLGTYAAGRMMGDRARERLSRYPESAVLAGAGGDPERITAATLFEAARARDPLACAVIDDACEALALAVGALVNLLNPEVIVITGGVARSLAPLREDILRRARRRALAAVLDATTVRVLPSDKRDTVRGGAALVFYEMARRGQAAA